MTNWFKFVSVTTTILSFVSLGLIIATRILLSHNTLFECDTDEDCLGLHSKCQMGQCLCEVIYLEPTYQCELYKPKIPLLLSIFSFLFFCLTIISIIILCIMYEQKIKFNQGE